MSGSHIHKYAVIETRTDGTVWVWGPFSCARADLAVDALQSLDGVDAARAVPMLPSSELTLELPDWTRTVTQPPVSG